VAPFYWRRSAAEVLKSSGESILGFGLPLDRLNAARPPCPDPAPLKHRRDQHGASQGEKRIAASRPKPPSFKTCGVGSEVENGIS
jgi:hypothetical protein